MKTLETILAEAKAEHDAMWETAINDPMKKVCQWDSLSEAMTANNGFSSNAFYQNNNGKWMIYS